MNITDNKDRKISVHSWRHIGFELRYWKKKQGISFLCVLKSKFSVFSGKPETLPTWRMTSLTRMASFRDTDTAVSSTNGADDITVDTTPSIRNRIAFKTGHILSNLTLSVWYSYALLYFQNVVTLSPLSAGVLFFISQILMAVTFLVINLGRDERIWKPFSSYGIQKARHAMGSAGILFAWPFAFTPCLFCEADTSHLVLGMYYLIPVILLSICWPLVELSYSSLMKEIRVENDNHYDASRWVYCSRALKFKIIFDRRNHL